MLKNIVMATTLTLGIVSAMADSPNYAMFIFSKIIAALFLLSFFVLLRSQKSVSENPNYVKAKTFFKDIIDSAVDFCCFLVIHALMLIGALIYAVIITPIAAGFVLWLIVGKAYKKIFS